MTRTVLNALKSVAVLVCITVVCVGLLAVCNMYFPKYAPALDKETAALINSIAKACDSDEDAYSGGYIVLLQEDEYGVVLSDYNNDNKARRAEILAVYGEIKGENTGAYIIESKSAGRDSDVVMLTAYKNGGIIGATVKKQNESYWNKLPEDLFAGVVGKTGAVDLVGELGKTGATLSLSAVDRAINLASSFAASYGEKLRSVISQKSKDSLKSAETGAGND